MSSSQPTCFSLRGLVTVAAVAVASTIALPAAHARDARVIRDWRAPIGYQFELEPHLLAGTNPPGPGVGSGVGAGVRASFVILPDGFLRNVNDSVAIGAGLDFGHYYSDWWYDGARDQCVHFAPGPNGTQVCTETTSYRGTYNYVYVPVVMQWNFWLTQRWSVFGEPGLNLYFASHRSLDISPALYVGGRFHIANGIAITGRLGYPASSIGLSFLF
jgi:hypothetical protein